MVFESKRGQNDVAVLITLIALLICGFLITFLLVARYSTTNVVYNSDSVADSYVPSYAAHDSTTDPYLDENTYVLNYIANRESKYSRSTSNDSADLSKGLVLYLPFDESSNSNIFADSKDGHNAACVGDKCPQSGVAGHRGNAVKFDGVNDLVEIPSSSAFSFGKEFSVSIWYKGTKNQAGQFLIGRWNGSPDSISWLMSFATGGIYNGTDFYVSEDGSAGNDAHRAYRRTPNLNMDGQWHNLVAVFKANHRIELYVDGNSVGEVVGDISLIDQVFSPTPAQSIRVGSGFGNFAQMQSFEGSVDELRIWNRALSSSEVKKVRNL